MKFLEHSNLKGAHAILGASKYHWLNYSDEKLINIYHNLMAVQRGTELHEFAAQCIRLGQRLPKSKKTLNMYVNDAIGFHMTPEQVLFYSENCFGTADAISYRNGILRIHDLKTGSVPAHIEQLMIYAGLFCLEYRVKPKDVEFELRIYQSDDILIANPDPSQVKEICDQIVHKEKIIAKLRSEEE